MVSCLTLSYCISARLFFYKEPRVELDFRGVTGTVHSESRGSRNTRILNKWNTLKWFQQVNHTPLCRRRWKTLFLLPACLEENSSLIPGLAIWYEPELVNKTCHPGFQKDATSALIHSTPVFCFQPYYSFQRHSFPSSHFPLCLLSHVDGQYLTEEEGSFGDCLVFSSGLFFWFSC